MQGQFFRENQENQCEIIIHNTTTLNSNQFHPVFGKCWWKQKIHFSFKSCYLLYLVFFHDSSSLINYKSWILLFHSVNLIIFFFKILIINGNFTKNKQTLTRKKMINCLRITITRKTRSGTNTYSQWWWW